MATATGFRIYHNPRCSKSRATLALLNDAGVEPEIVEYLDTAPSAAEIDQLCRRLGVEPNEIVRFNEGVAKELGLTKADQRPRKEWLELIAAHPILLERPIVVRGEEARVGRPPEAVKDLLG